MPMIKHCPKCDKEIIAVMTAKHEMVDIDLDTLSDIDKTYIEQIDVNKHPILFRPDEHKIHIIGCRGTYLWRRYGEYEN